MAGVRLGRDGEQVGHGGGAQLLRPEATGSDVPSDGGSSGMVHDDTDEQRHDLDAKDLAHLVVDEGDIAAEGGDRVAHALGAPLGIDHQFIGRRLAGDVGPGGVADVQGPWGSGGAPRTVTATDPSPLESDAGCWCGGP